jgi:hypothetical protein
VTFSAGADDLIQYYFADASSGDFSGALVDGFHISDWASLTYKPHEGIFAESLDVGGGNYDNTPGWHFTRTRSALLFNAPDTLTVGTYLGTAPVGQPWLNNLYINAYRGPFPGPGVLPDRVTISVVEDFARPAEITGSYMPEPATWAMMLMGFFGLGGALRRRYEMPVRVR